MSKNLTYEIKNQNRLNNITKKYKLYLPTEQAEKEIKNSQYEDLGYAKIDHNRKERLGVGEVVFCQNKPDEFLSKIYKTIYKEDNEVLGTRATIANQINKLAIKKENT